MLEDSIEDKDEDNKPVITKVNTLCSNDEVNDSSNESSEIESISCIIVECTSKESTEDKELSASAKRSQLLK